MFGVGVWNGMGGMGIEKGKIEREEVGGGERQRVGQREEKEEEDKGKEGAKGEREEGGGQDGVEERSRKMQSQERGSKQQNKFSNIL